MTVRVPESLETEHGFKLTEREVVFSGLEPQERAESTLRLRADAAGVIPAESLPFKYEYKYEEGPPITGAAYPGADLVVFTPEKAAAMAATLALDFAALAIVPGVLGLLLPLVLLWWPIDPETVFKVSSSAAVDESALD